MGPVSKKMIPKREQYIDKHIGNNYTYTVRIISRKTLTEFSQAYPETKEDLNSWYFEVKKENWKSPQDIKGRYPKSRIIGKDRIIFNILNNRYRLIVKVNYAAGIVFVRFIGTHKEYDRIDPKGV